MRSIPDCYQEIHWYKVLKKTMLVLPSKVRWSLPLMQVRRKHRLIGMDLWLKMQIIHFIFGEVHHRLLTWLLNMLLKLLNCLLQILRTTTLLSRVTVVSHTTWLPSLTSLAINKQIWELLQTLWCSSIRSSPKRTLSMISVFSLQMAVHNLPGRISPIILKHNTKFGALQLTA